MDRPAPCLLAPVLISLSSRSTGNGANVIQVGPESALLFLLNDLYKPYIAEDPKRMSVFEKFVCGSAAGASAMTLVYPMYVVQNRMLGHTHTHTHNTP